MRSYTRTPFLEFSISRFLDFSGFSIQCVARPPLMSMHWPVVKLHSSLASQAMSAATSTGYPTRPIGIRCMMYCTCGGVTC